MNWSDIKDVVGKIAPVLGTALGGPAGAAVGGLISSALGVENSPDRVAAAMQSDPEATAKLVQLQNAHIESLRRMALEAETSRLAEINKTMRAEAAASDPYVRRWRPTFGYVAAGTWAIQIAGTAYAMVIHPQNAAHIIEAVTSMTPMWGIALAVLGINIHKRSQDKQVSAGQQPIGILQAVLGKRNAD